MWAPSAGKVDLVIDGQRCEMPPSGQGWFNRVERAKPGQGYAFAVDGSEDLVPDPASRFQPDDLKRFSSIVDPARYDWQDGGWTGRSWNDVVLCEVHLGTATPEGTYAAFEKRLVHYKEAGITAIELMPIAETSGIRTWGLRWSAALCAEQRLRFAG